MPRIKDAAGGKVDKKDERRCPQRHRSRPAAAGNAALAVEVPVPAEAPPPPPGTMTDPNGGGGAAPPLPGLSKRAAAAVDPAVSQDEDEDGAAMDGQHVEKKRRLSVEQVKSLERHFEEDNKLEPERKLVLAKELGLQPRQVAVWFQNRRARWKTKQLEKDYDALKESLNALKGDYKSLEQEKQELEAEVNRLNGLLSSKYEQHAKAVEVDKGSGDAKVDSASNSLATGTATPANAARKDCSSSWDSDGSEIADDDQITPRLDQSESGRGFSLHGDEDGVLMDTLGCHIAADVGDGGDADAYAGNSMVYSPPPPDRMIPKLEDQIFDLDDQGSLSWWDWS